MVKRSAFLDSPFYLSKNYILKKKESNINDDVYFGKESNGKQSL
jgi:hypothetical protein